MFGVGVSLVGIKGARVTKICDELKGDAVVLVIEFIQLGELLGVTQLGGVEYLCVVLGREVTQLREVEDLSVILGREVTQLTLSRYLSSRLLDCLG